MQKLLVLFILSFSCVSIAKQSAIDGYQPPSFNLKLSLTENAEAWLKHNNESIIVDAFFYGEAKNGANIVLDIKTGLYQLGGKQFELTDTREVSFFSFEFDPRKIAILANPDYRVIINVYSGRKSTPRNGLDCDAIMGPVSQIQNLQLTISCDLIDQPPSSATQ